MLTFVLLFRFSSLSPSRSASGSLVAGVEGGGFDGELIGCEIVVGSVLSGLW